MDAFCAPYLEPEARRPLLQWTREISVGGEPAITARRLERGCGIAVVTDHEAGVGSEAGRGDRQGIDRSMAS